MLVKSYYNPGASLFYPVAAAPGLGPLTAAGGNPLAPAAPNGVPITAAQGLNVAAQQAAINAAAAVSASALHHNPAVLSQHANHQLSVHHPAISPHLSQHHHMAAATVTNSGQQQQLSNHLNCNFTNNAVDGGAGGHAVSVAANSLQQQATQHRHHSSQNNHSQKNNLLQQQQPTAVHQVTSNPTLLHHQQQNVQQPSSQPGGGPASLQNLVGHSSVSGLHHQANSKQIQSSPAAKKFRPSYTRPSNKHSRYVPKPMPQELSNLKTYSSPDILICGNCREMFSDLTDMLDHKRDYCKLRFTCKCDVLNEECTSCDLSTSELMNINCNQGSQGDTNSGGDASINMSSSSRNLTSEATTINSPISLPGKDNVNTHQSGEQDVENGANHHQQSKIRSGTAVQSKTTCGDASSTKAPKPRQKYLHCVSCNSPFSNAWDLMVHVQAAHMMNIYQLADSNKLQQRASKTASGSENVNNDKVQLPAVSLENMVTTITSQCVDVNSDSTATVSTMGQSSSCDTSLIHSSVNHDSTTTSSALISGPHTSVSSQPIMPGLVTEQNNEIVVNSLHNV